jgi:hypothetical protein
MQISTTGKAIPLITWVHKDIAIRGAPGIRMIRAEMARIEV